MAEQHAQQRTQFADLVRERRHELGLSLASLQDRAVDPASGTQVKSGWIHRLESGEPVNAPQVPQLKALANGLQLPLPVLQESASAQFFGVDTVWNESGTARALVQRAERLTPAQLSQLLRLIDTFAPEEN
ncbi:helix-turn-helix domain-containing protein [Streptomyces sp. NPDC050560]|uniref:helix-turn-helix domain-containing protein n=1 Tax=Streptomyces sp. NPDC050560 TaxID=3365630 RepID=UPI0037B0170A